MWNAISLVLYDSDSLLVSVFKLKLSDYSMFWDGHSGRAFLRMQGILHPSTYSCCYWQVFSARSVLSHRTRHLQRSQDLLQSCCRSTCASPNVFPCQMVGVYAWSGFCLSTAEDPSFRFFVTMHVKDQILGNVFGGAFSDSFQQNLPLHRHC